MGMPMLFHLRQEQARSAWIVHQCIKSVAELMEDISPAGTAYSFFHQCADGMNSLVAFSHASFKRSGENFFPHFRFAIVAAAGAQAAQSIAASVMCAIRNGGK